MNKENINYSPISVIFKMNNNSNYSPVSVIDCKQINELEYPKLTTFSLTMSKKLKDSTFEYENYYRVKKSVAVNEDCENYILLKSDFKINKGENVCMSAKNMEQYEINAHKKYYKERYVGQQFGIVPTIPYNSIAEIAKMYRESSYGNYKYYALGYYPKQKIDFARTWCWVDSVDELHHIGKQKQEHLPSESEFYTIDEEFTFPTIIDDKLELETYNVYQAKTQEGSEIKAIKYNGEWFRIEPVIWKKIGNNLVCTDVLFESPVHMKNDYVKNADIQSLDDTFLKWYIDNVFTQDLFKYVDLSFMKEKILIGIEEDIDLKLREIERLKQMKANLILQQQSEEHIIDTAHKNITSLFESDNKNEETTTFHK